MPKIFEAVEFGDLPSLLLLGGVLILAGICALLWMGMRSINIGRSIDGSFEIHASGRLPLSSHRLEQAGEVVSAVLEPPQLTAERRQQLDTLGRFRGHLLWLYRVMMLVIGIVGIGFAVILFRSATAANMHVLPGGLALLFSLGALLEAALPNRRLRNIASRHSVPEERFSIQVNRAAPRTLSIEEADITRAREAMGRGLALEEAVRTTYPNFDALDTFEKLALLNAFKTLLRSS